MEKVDLVLQGSCNQYALEIANHYLNLEFVNNIIMSCWENDPISSNHNRILFVRSQDVEFAGVGNRNRQIKSSLAGLQKASTEFSVKMRTDQKISLDSMRLMYNFYNQHKEQDMSFSNGQKPKNRICVAGMFRNFPFHPRDHIFWGNTSDLIDVFNISYDHVSLSDDYNQYLRAEAYICMWYYAKFDKEIEKFVKEPHIYLTDAAPLKQEALDKSAFWEAKIFTPFPRIDFEWPKHGLSSYHYDLTARVFGEYWSS